jgi:hypothetical protein
MLSPRRWGSLFWALFTLGSLGALAMFWQRLSSVLHCWHWNIAEGREGPGIYALWRVLHGYPLYEWPNRPPYSLTLYNFGFYHFYAAVMRLFGVNDESLLIAPRFLTLLASPLGALLFARLAWSLAPARTSGGRIALGALSFGIWFGTQLFAWWPLGIRPDLWALLTELAAVALVLRGLESDSPLTFLLASLVFFLAWSLKQSALLSLLGSLAAVFVLKRRWPELLALGAPCSLLIGLCLAFGGERYRVCLLVAPAISRFHLKLLFEVLSRALPQNAWHFGFAPLALLLEARSGLRAAWQRRALTERAVLIIGLIALVFGAAGLGREGANKNYLFDAYVLGTLASWAALVRFLEAPSPPRVPLVLAAALLVPWTVFPFAQLAMPNVLGRVDLCSAEQKPTLDALAQTLARLPKPLYSSDDIRSQPWRATDNRYPAVVLDITWAAIGVRDGFLPPGFPDPWLAEQHFASAYVLDGDPLIATWRAHGGTCSDLPELVQGRKAVICRLPYATASQR